VRAAVVDRMSESTGRGGMPSLARVGLAAAVGLVAAGIQAVYGPVDLAPLVGWDVLALTLLGLTWWTIWPMTAEETCRRAERHDNTRAVTDALLLTAAGASLIAVGVVLFGAPESVGFRRVLRVGFGVVSIALSWTLVHTSFTLRYARMYYTQPGPSVDFNQAGPPRYSDFAYLAFTIGMTFQVSDTALRTDGMRRIVLRHCLISYLFGTVILAATVSLIAGLSA
jgi:uncharacterized membrane protein